MAAPGDGGPEPSGAFTEILPDLPTTHQPPEPGRLTSDSCPLASAFSGARRCASCRTQRTPLWRDAEDGTPLCNACGIRSAGWRRGWGGGRGGSVSLCLVSLCLAGMGYWEGEITTLGEVVSLAPPECWIFVPPSQVQEVWHPVLQLLVGAQEKCAAQEVMWQMWDVPGPQPRPTPGRVSPSSPSQACPASVSPGGEWEEALRRGKGETPGSRRLQPALPLPSPHSGTPGRRSRPRALEPLSQRFTGLFLGPCCSQAWPSSHSGSVRNRNPCCL